MPANPLNVRRFAAVLAADVVGYSRLMGQDERGTLDRLREHRQTLIDPALAKHRGRLVKTTGDGLLVEFPSVVEAVECALGVQRAMAERDATLPESSRFRFRIGINLGDIIVEDDDIFGDGVNVAARLQEIAEPGGICLSEDAYRQVRGKLAFNVRDLGAQRLKNIAEPVGAYSIGIAATSPAATPILTPALPPDKPSIAVLPFDNLSADPEQEYFADGMTEDIITELSKIGGLFVIARNSSFFYKKKQFTVRQVGQELGVRYVLEGSVRKAGNRVRINAQLIEAGTDHHLWADRIDGELTDVFALQDKVTSQVVEALAVRLTARERIGPRRSETASVEAYDLFLRAREHYFRFTPESNARARQLLDAVIAVDSSYARAYAINAECYLQLWNQFWSRDRDATLGRARALAERAAALGGAESEAHAVLANVLVWQFQHEDALAHAERSIRAEPNNARNLGIRAMVLGWSGRHEEAISAIDAAMRLDPNYGGWMLWTKGQSLICLGRYEEAVSTLRAGLARLWTFMPLHLYLMSALYLLGRGDEAVAAAKAAGSAAPAMAPDELRDVPFKNPADRERLASAFRGVNALLKAQGMPISSV